MTSISQLTQSRLSVLLFDETTNALLNKIPVYAEVSMTVELPPYTVDQHLEFSENETPVRQWLATHNSILDEINNVIVANVAESDFNDIADKHQLYLAILGKLKDNLEDRDTKAQKRLLVTKIVMQVLKRLEIATGPQSNKKSLLVFPLGTLASDHAGYLSYDLTNVISRFETMVRGGMPLKPDISFFIYPLGREDLKIDVLQQGRFTPDVIFAKLPIELPREFDALKRVNLPSMQQPGLEDWYLSPGSFALNPAFFVGADGCENLYPANFATHEFSFYQIIRGRNILIKPVNDNPNTSGINETVLEVRTGWSLEYSVSWQPLGHTLGQIVYSLPLAPGEIVKIAILDWARKSIDSRNEDLTVKEQLTHNTHRDRNISETVDAAMQEWQRGGSFMGGVAGSYGGAGFGISGALGGGYSTSSGDRNVHASTVQQISDAFAQASSSVRELRSTIVIQSDQQEHAKAETRVVANHNHSHALTMLYYEVLRHYKVATQFMRVRPSLLVQYAEIDFRNIDNIVTHRRMLESVLIEGRYLGCFDAVQKLQCFSREIDRKKAQAALTPNLNDVNELGEIKLVVGTKKATGKIVAVSLITKNREEVALLLVSPQWDPFFGSASVSFGNLPDQIDDANPGTLASPLNYRQDGQVNVFVLKPYKNIVWRDVDGLMVKVFANATSWEIESVQAMATVGDNTWVMLDNKELITIPVNGQKFLSVQSYKDIPKDPEDLLSEDERCCVNKLKNHLSENAFHYKKAIWLQEDPNERANRFKSMLTNVGSEAILDLIDNRPIDVLGDYVVFPARKFHENSEELSALEKVKVEKLMTLPTRGVFAEAKLGHCNASEEIDNTRFWDWQKSPITEEPPGIDNVNVNDSKNATPNLTPTQLPSPIVNIVNPQNLPDPTGMANVMNLLGKADIFRDMSVSKEVEDLLKNLSNNSVTMGQASNKAGNILQQRANSGGGGSGGTTANGSSKPSPDEQHNQLQVLRNAANSGDITTEKKNQLAGDYLQNATQANSTLAFGIDATTAEGADLVTLIPLHADEADQVLINYEFKGKFAIAVPQAVLMNARDEISDVNVHVYFAAGGVLGEDHSDFLLHGLRGASNDSDWVTIAVPGIPGSSNPISDAQILNCLKAVGIQGAPKKLRLSGHSRGTDSLVASFAPNKITTLAIIDRVTFLDEAVEHAEKTKKDGTPDPRNGQVTYNRIDVLKAKVPASRMISYEVGNRSEDRSPAPVVSRRIASATYVELDIDSMAAIGCVRLIQDAVRLRPDIAPKLAAKPALEDVVNKLNLQPRGSFTTKGAAGKDDLVTFYTTTAKTEIAAVTAAKNSVLAFINGQNLAGYMRVNPYVFGWGVAAHHFFVAEIAHELTD